MLRHISMRQKIIVMLAVMSALFLVSLSQTIVATALTKIVTEFGSFSSLGLVVTAYLLANTVTVPLAGKMSDMFGRKPLLIAGVVVFTVGSWLSGMAGNIEQLIAFRVVQGIGGGIIMANAFTIIGDLFSPRERGRWQGLTGAIFGIASVAGPLLGGFLTETHQILGLTTDWRWTFFINVPIGVISAILIMVFSPPIRHEQRPIIDYAGAGLLTVALASLVLSVDNTEMVFSGLLESGVTLAALRAVLLAVAAAAAAGFVAVERRAKDPVLPLRFFKNRNFSLIMVSALLFGAAFMGAILYLTQFNQQVFGASPTEAGMMLLPMVGGMALTSAIIGQMVSRSGKYKMFVVAGFTVAAISVLALISLQPDTAYWHEAVIMTFVGIGLGAGMPIINLAVQNEFHQKDLGAATASSQLFRGLGSTLGLAILSAIMTSGMAASLGDINSHPYVSALRQAPEASKLLPGRLDTDAALQLNGQRETIARQVEASLHSSVLPADKLRPIEEHFAKLQADFNYRVTAAFTDSLHRVFVASAATMFVALAVISRITERPLRSSNEDSGIE